MARQGDPWTRNLRELRHYTERCILSARGESRGGEDAHGIGIDAGRLLALRAASIMARDQAAGELVMMAKIHAAEMAVRAADAAMRTFAGWGNNPDFVVERIYRDSLANVPAGLTTDRLRELLICRDVDVDPWEYEPFDWLSPAGLRGR